MLTQKKFTIKETNNGYMVKGKKGYHVYEGEGAFGRMVCFLAQEFGETGDPLFKGVRWEQANGFFYEHYEPHFIAKE